MGKRAKQVKDNRKESVVKRPYTDMEIDTEQYCTEEYEPNAEQVRLLLAYADPEVKPTITGICEATGVSRSNYYFWRKDPKFVQWWNAMWKELMGTYESYLDNLGLKRASMDFRYWEAMQMKYANFRRKGDMTSDGDKIGFNISDLDKQTYEELQRTAAEQNRTIGASKD